MFTLSSVQIIVSNIEVMRSYFLVFSVILSLSSYAQCLYTTYEPGHVVVVQSVMLKAGARANFQLARTAQSATISFSLPSDSVILTFPNRTRIVLTEAVDGAYPITLSQLGLLRDRGLDSMLVSFKGVRSDFHISDSQSRIGLQTSAGCVLKAHLSPALLPADPSIEVAEAHTAGWLLEAAGKEKNMGIAIGLAGTVVAGLIASGDEGWGTPSKIIASGSLIAAGLLTISGNMKLIRAGRVLQRKDL